MSQPCRDTAPRSSRPPAPVVASDADRLRQGLPLESGEALPPPPERPLH